MAGKSGLLGGESISQYLNDLKTDIQNLYLRDSVPWIVGYSGGKDSTAVLQLVWYAISDLPKDKLLKPIHIISTDTLVENPIVASWVENSHKAIKKASALNTLPFYPHRLMPEVSNTFWVNLIGKGYPAPRHKFRWCTERLKIKPSNKFIMDVTKESGESILVLGARKTESSTRSAVMKKHEKNRVTDKLSPSGSLVGCNIFTPIEDWTNDDVWMYLMQFKNPWGYHNQDLLTMYQGASPDGECPLVVDSSTPSCGDSRFGCWVCTLVEKDKSMSAMIQNDAEKEWMAPLLAIRNALDFRLMGNGDTDNSASDRHLRDFRRMNGKVSFMGEGERLRVIPGPYTQESRANWLKMLLEAQKLIQNTGPAYVKDIELITVEELNEIRRIWLFEKNETEDLLPSIYEKIFEKSFQKGLSDFTRAIDTKHIRDLKEHLKNEPHIFEVIRNSLNAHEVFRYKRSGKKPKDFTEDFLQQSLTRNADEAVKNETEVRNSVQLLSKD